MYPSAMIVDTHTHVFPPMGRASGHESAAEHMRYVQQNQTTHHQPARRVDDNSIREDRGLFDGVHHTLSGLTDVNFRGGGHGTFRWTINDVDYYTQYLPPSSTDLESTADGMVAQMDYAGVDKAVVQTGHLYGTLNEHLSGAVAQHPDRLWAPAMVDEWLIDHDSEMQALDYALNELNLGGLSYQTGNPQIHGRSEPLDDPVFHPFWDHVADLGIPVLWNISVADPQGTDPYIAELTVFTRWRERYPDVPVLLPHGLPLGRFMVEGVPSDGPGEGQCPGGDSDPHLPGRSLGLSLARIHRRTPMDGVRTAEGGG